ncbi:uncharacterized protein B0I36DRAFT_358421 [Microdochium trichocladiopsis]|uniref:DUF7704 domain-containing protein n=1 Tax=Microdochium trichocladiopsis TaxID=1682393 RepID=A0A9P9C0L8_9PEZI|nr:uncharacterized protein B0I36DRAFT_358421 [Microdochium trichocladiopsis]KAH7041234.1 hypothetical protein B0I36DRAFT_358421 [Microdochium trichocladiopsis]
MATPPPTTTTYITHLHPIYRIWFLWADPIITWATVGAAFLSPGLLYDALMPPHLSAARDPTHDFLIRQMGALYIPIALAATVLLRATRDFAVWKIVQGSILVVDAILVALIFSSLKDREVLYRPAEWIANDWQNLGLTVWVAVLRALFAAGFGVKTESVKSKSI